MDKILFKRRDESFEGYCHRISLLMQDPNYNLTWTKVANIINKATGSDYSADKYRKQEKRYLSKLMENIEEQEEKEEEVNRFETFDKETITTNFEKGETTSFKELPLTKNQLTNPSELLKAHGFNPNEFSLKSATNSKTLRTNSNGSKSVYTSRIVVKAKENDLVNEVKELSKYFETFRSPKINLTKNFYNNKEFLVVPLYDFHWGRLPDIEEFKRYDIEEEKTKIISHIKKYIEKFQDRNFNKIYLIVGQDFLNSSFTGYTSSQSHLQSNAIDFRTMFRTGAELLISIIDMFADKCNKLEVVGSLGNHDISEEVALFQLLKAYYRNCDGINVDDTTRPRKYLDLGNSCVGLGHLDKEKNRSYGLMQVEAKDIWAKTKTHIFIAGHLHHFEVNSDQGVEIYRVPSICPPDRWTVEQGYTQNEPKTMCFVFDEKEGLIETHFMYL